MQAPPAHSPWDSGLAAPTLLCPHTTPPTPAIPLAPQGLPATDLGEVPQPLRWARHVLALLQGGHAGPAVVHQALGVRQEGGGAEGAQLQEALRAVAHELGGGGQGDPGHHLPGPARHHRGARPATVLLPACPVPSTAGCAPIKLYL